MNIELEQKLFDKYPKIFSKKDEESNDNLMYFGFEHNDGWYWLIDNLCNTIQNYKNFDSRRSQVVAVQVKEKFGTLRFYVETSNEFVEGIIKFAEDLSGTICEMCGTTKKVGKTTGWIKTICDKCYRKHMIAKNVTLDWIETK